MLVTRTQLVVAFGLAAMVHMAAAAVFFWAPPPSGARAVGVHGVEVSLGTAGGGPAEAAARVSEVPESTPVEIAEAQTIQASETSAETRSREVPTERAEPVKPKTAIPVETIATRTVEAVEPPVEQEISAEIARPVEPEVAVPVETAEERVVEAAETPVEQPVQEVPTEMPQPVEPEAAIPVATAGAPPRPVKALPPEVMARSRSVVPPPKRRRRPKESAPKRVETRPAPAVAQPRAASTTGPPRNETASASPAKAGTRGKAGKGKNGVGSSNPRSGGGSPGLSDDYISELLAWLRKHKQYPRQAQRRRQEGTALLYFEMDRQGRVQSSRLHRSSGHAALDAEVKALIRRAEPLPIPPPEIQGERIRLIVPFQFFLR